MAGAGVATLAVAGLLVAGASGSSAKAIPDRSAITASPIKHLVVIFDENVSYDHYFGTYPKAKNTDGTPFYAVTSTPKNNNLVTSGTLESNPNLYSPTRLTPSEALTCDQNHAYGPEQKAENNGAQNAFVQNVSVDSCSGEYGTPGLSMDYYDGNTVTGLWNYAQQYAMSDNSFDSTFGPSTPGALNLVSGQTHGFKEVDSVTGKQVTTPGTYVLASPDKNGVGTVINDPDPAYDDCADNNHTSTNTLAAATGINIGDLLNDRGVTWGWFQGGFTPTTKATGSKLAVCGSTHTNIGGGSSADYSAHHNPFEYYASTSNPHHLPPTSTAMIGHSDQANHEYDLSSFNKAVAANNIPAVSFLKAPEYQDGHAGYSDPIDEQHFLVSEINRLQESPAWSSTAVVIAYDDSDGWYDHVASTITNASHDATNDAAICNTSKAKVAAGYADRCGPGPRLPLLVISPWAKTNYVGHTPLEQASITKFIENNWFTGAIGGGSFDARANNLTGLMDFTQSNNKQVLLRTSGAIASITPIKYNKPVIATKVITAKPVAKAPITVKPITR
ncbi:MAG: alkaline phosphatase family protein [Jatrophihabitans sp.]|nr:alkaline phosphatase family protein [Jatrophihabitans sp.]